MPISEEQLGPKEVILAMQDNYWHQVKQAAGYLRQNIRTPESSNAVGLIVGTDSGNHADALCGLRGHMPSRQSEMLLGEFISYLRTLNTIGEDLEHQTKIVDEAYLCYSNLLSTLLPKPQ